MGDAAAALVGKAVGKHHVKEEEKMPAFLKWVIRHADPKKTWEGTGAMALTSLAVCAFCLIKSGMFFLPAALFAALVVAPVSAAVELVTHNGNDTVTVPTANALVLYLMMALFG